MTKLKRKWEYGDESSDSDSTQPSESGSLVSEENPSRSQVPAPLDLVNGTAPGINEQSCAVQVQESDSCPNEVSLSDLSISDETLSETPRTQVIDDPRCTHLYRKLLKVSSASPLPVLDPGQDQDLRIGIVEEAAAILELFKFPSEEPSAALGVEVRGESSGESPGSSNSAVSAYQIQEQPVIHRQGPANMDCDPRNREESQPEKDDLVPNVPRVNQEPPEAQFDSGYHDRPQPSCSTSGQEVSAADEDFDSALNDFDREMDSTGVNRSFEPDDEDLELLDSMVSPDPIPSTIEFEEVQVQEVSGTEDLTVQESNDDEAGDEEDDKSHIWGLRMDQINTEKGDPREALSFKPQTVNNGIVDFESDQLMSEEMDEEEQETEFEPMLPLNIEELDREDKDDILKLVLARAFKDFLRFDLNVHSQILGEAALTLANELGIRDFKLPGPKSHWIKNWKTNFLNDPYALSFGPQVGRIVDTKEGDVLHRNLYLTGKSVNNQLNYQFQVWRISSKDCIGKSVALTQGKLRVVVWIKSLADMSQTKKRLSAPSCRSYLPLAPLVPTPALMLTSRFRQRRKPKASRPKNTDEDLSDDHPGGKSIETIMRYNEALEASSASIEPPEPQPNPESTNESLEAAEEGELELEDNPFDDDFDNLITDEQLALLCQSGDEDVDAMSSSSESESEC